MYLHNWNASDQIFNKDDIEAHYKGTKALAYVTLV